MKHKNQGCLAFFTAILGVYQIIFAISVLQQREMLGQLTLSVDIQAGLAGLWAIILLTITVGLFRDKLYAVRYTHWLIVAYVVYNLTRITIYVQSDYDRNRLPMVFLLSMAIMLVPLLLGVQRNVED